MRVIACKMKSWCRSVEQTAVRQVSHERRNAAGPGRSLVAVDDLVFEHADARRRDPHAIADLVRETQSRRAAIPCRREHRAEIECEAVRVLVMLADGLADELGGVAADEAHRALAFEHEAVGPF